MTAHVGSFKSNTFGLYDMLGNVFEWSEDIYSEKAYRHHKMDNSIYRAAVGRSGCSGADASSVGRLAYVVPVAATTRPPVGPGTISWASAS